MPSLDIQSEECSLFPGGWSMPPREMHDALKSVTYTDTLKILEMGSGEGTRVLAILLRSKGIPNLYVSYENDPRFLVKDPGVTTIMWSEFPKELYHDIFDLVIIDGPNGKIRKNWYPLLRSVVRPGTVIAIDDFGHYKEFGEALDKNFTYTTISEYEPQARRGVTWKVVVVNAIK